MIDLDEMEKLSQEMIERGIGKMEAGASCYETIELIERLRQAEKDAARYRWLMKTPSWALVAMARIGTCSLMALRLIQSAKSMNGLITEMTGECDARKI